MDLIGLIEMTNGRNQYALTLICMLTTHVICTPLADKSVDTALGAYQREVYYHLEGSKKILSDNGSEFKNLFLGVATQLGTIHSFSSPYIFQANGWIETSQKFLKNCIRKFPI